MNKVLLFDFDGTIADSFDNFLEIVETLSDKYNFPKIPLEEIEKSRALDARTLVKRLKIPLYKIPFLAHDMKKMQKEKIAQLHSFKALPEVLISLKNKGYTLGIITSNAKENVELFLKNNNIEVFDNIVGDAGMFGKDKLISNFLKQNDISKSDALYIGDEIRDIHASQKAEVKIVAVTWGFNSKAGLSKASPDFLIDKPEELLELLSKQI